MSAEWLTVGAKVGTYQDGAFPTARVVTVERIGKRDVVLSDGSRFNVNRLYHSASTWSQPTYLTSLDDPAFVRVAAKARRRVISTRLEQIAKELRDPNADTAALCAKAITQIEALMKDDPR